MKDQRLSHLDAVVGKNEEQNETYIKYVEVSTGVFDTVMRQKQLSSAWLCQVAGSCGG